MGQEIQSEPVRVALIYGSTRENRMCDLIAGWAAGQVRRRQEFRLDEVDPAVLALPARHEQDTAPAVQALQRRLEEADAFLVVTPEYNHSYPAALKFLIDSVNGAWQAKPVAFVSYGGVSGGLRAVEHLRGVFAELHATTVRDVVSFASYWEQFDSVGELKSPERAERSMSRMLDYLLWWSRALRDARTVIPYQQVG